MKAKLSIAAALSAALALICHSAAQASEVALSLSTPAGYCFVEIPTNMQASIEGRGMVSNETTGTIPLRYEDVAFLREAISERLLLSTNSKERVTEEIGSDYRTGIVGINGLEYRNRLFARPEAQAFTNGIAAYDPGNDINEPNVWSRVFGTSYPSMFLTTNDITQSAAKVVRGSPLRFSDIKDCYEYVGKATRLCLSDKTLTSLDGKGAWAEGRDRHYSGLIQRYDALKGEWVYGTNCATNTVDVYKGSVTWMKRLSLGATRRKSVGRDGGKVVTDVVKSSGTSTATVYDTSNAYPIIDLRSTLPELGTRTARSVTLYIVGRLQDYRATTGDGGSSTTDTYHYFVIRVEAQTAADNAPGSIICLSDGRGFLDDAFDRAVALVYGGEGLPRKTVDEVLDEVSQPPDPTGEDDRHVNTSNTKTYTYQVNLYGAYILYNDLKFNARVLEDGEEQE